ncbi:MAG: hypothetical protein G8D58_07500 [gamma proteobacterium symbiont of Phacoides pectinatus]
MDISIHTVRVMLDAEMAGRELVIPEAEVEPDPNEESSELEHPTDESFDADHDDGGSRVSSSDRT